MDLFIGYLTLILVVGMLFFQGLFVEKFSNNGIIYGIRVPEEYKNLLIERALKSEGIDY